MSVTYDIYFKLVYRDSIKIKIPNNIKINELNSFIKKYIKTKYNLNEFDIIESNKRENGVAIIESNNYFYDIYNKNSAFYIRPKNNTKICYICFQRKNINEFRNINCNHNIFCDICINTWLRINSTCPLCRQNI